MMNDQGRVSPGSAAPAEERSCSWLNIWLFLLFALAIKAALVTICLVVLFCHSSDQPSALQQQFSEWKCDSEVPQGTDRGWTCCPTGWSRFQRSCYFLSPDTMSWPESEQNCTGMGSQLVVINSKEEQVFLSEQIRQSKEPKPDNFYIGLFAEKVGQWQWVDKTPYSVTAAFWRKGEPSEGIDENCVIIHRDTELPKNWNNVRCLRYHRICEAAAVTV
ncbi:C-type lectin domain family 4 member E-like [Hirundo rustica]|uniref:C-type lectin domain family 4 member E-like n=1 Tax=Hirundo rustica TaxID=43150 RepID=UPI001A952A26|nr:C-type lectin domain family 4 member E-like [Hirundo rustica]XP_058275361.1 C-type lectin domain family 4 member E-like [Hirundo rustica]